MQVVTVPIDRVTPYARNPRKTDTAVSKVAESLREFGWRQPIVVAPDMVVVVGHVRLAAARMLGMTSVPIHIAENLTADQLKAYRIADNRTGEEAKWDFGLLAMEIGDLTTAGFNLQAMGFSLGELDAIRSGQMGAEPPPPPARIAGNLAERFGVPPFSVLSAREGWWQARKRAWLNLGIRSEIGRGQNNLTQARPAGSAMIDFYARKRAHEAEIGRAVTYDEFRDHLASIGELVDDRDANRERMEAEQHRAIPGGGGNSPNAAWMKGQHGAVPGGGGGGAYLRRSADGYSSASPNYRETTPEQRRLNSHPEIDQGADGRPRLKIDRFRDEAKAGPAVAYEQQGKLNAIMAQRGNGNGPARTFGQDLMRGEHVVGQKKRSGMMGMHQHGPNVRQNPDGTLNYDPPLAGRPPAGLTYGNPRIDEFDHYRRREAERTSQASFLNCEGDTDDVSMRIKAGGARRTAPPIPAGLVYGELPKYDGSANTVSGTSVFDPVLCELAYRWFCPPGGMVFDPFAGGSVRGIVSAWLGRSYTGIDLSARQIDANREQWSAIREGRRPTVPDAPRVDDPDELTPIEAVGDVLVKRDDLFVWAGAPGGKVRTCLALARAGIAEGKTGLVTAGSRASPQVNIVARIAAALGVPARCHTPKGTLSPEVEAARSAGAEIVQHKAGYNNVIIARARADAAARNWVEIPFGMECAEAVAQTRRQAANVPPDVRRIVVPVGSGMSLAGILHGLDDAGLTAIPVLGVVVGADPVDRLDRYAPADWQERVTLVPSGTDYHDAAAETAFGHIDLDPHYEAKCLPFVGPGDLIWVVGVRATAAARPSVESKPAAAPAPRPDRPDPVWIVGDSRDANTLLPDGFTADLIWTCPPYGDLEQYSDDPADLSAMKHEEFLTAYRTIIAAACDRLAPDRFAAVTIGDIRDPAGMCRALPAATIAAFEAAGCRFYNEAILVTAVGSLPIRAGRQFEASRKLGRTHQSVLVFVKGDPKRAAAAVGTIEFGEVEPDPAAP